MSLDLLSRVAAGGRLPWRAWGPAALAEAREHELPLLILVGESCDHWSARQIALIDEDAELVDLLRLAFVPVLAATHLHPDLARRAQEAVALSAGAGGSPVLCFCTPEAAIIGAVPFRPARDEGGQTGLARFCLQVAQIWQEDPTAVRADAADLAAAFTPVPRPLDEGRRVLLLDNVEASAMAASDELAGGFGQAPKRPLPAVLGFLLQRAGRRQAPPRLREHLELSCRALAAGGLHDHLAGGFHRACTDSGWSVPFFEKRLTEQAQLVPILLAAADLLDRPLWRHVALQALDWTLRALVRPDGSCAHGLHAIGQDDKGRSDNGAHYLWTRPRVAAVCGQEGAGIVAQRFFDPDLGPGARQNLAVRGDTDERAARRLPELCARLLAARQERPHPAREECASLAAHGQLLCALAAALPHDPAGTYQQHGERLADLLCDALALSAPVHAGASAADLRAPPVDALPADAEDLAWAGLGCLAWAERCDHETARSAARRAAELLQARWQEAAAPIQGGAGLLPQPVLAVADSDDAPSALAVALRLWCRLHRLDGDERWLVVARTWLHGHGGALRQAPLAVAGLAHSWDEASELAT
ncbi:MAG: DUF255 domain-containing protein [Planctomycetota bacterium]